MVILTAVMLTVGGLALANRSSQGLLGSVFRGFGLQAREAAEIGMNRIVSELNREGNRGLLRARGTSVESGLWNTADTALFHTSKCPKAVSNDLATNPNLAYQDPSNSSYGLVYVQDDGTISNSASGARRAYRLITSVRPPESELTVFQEMPGGKGELTLEVEGRSLRPDGTIASTVRLRKTFQLVPKCCGVPFGGASYGASNAACVDFSSMLGLGLLGGTGSTTGEMRITGSSSITGLNATTTIPINDVYCLADANGSCVVPGNTVVKVNLINPRPTDFPPAKIFPASLEPVTEGEMKRPQPNDKNGFIRCLTDGDALITDPEYSTTSNRKKCIQWGVDATLSNTAQFPNYCKLLNDEVHCKLKSLDYKSTDVVFFTSATRKLRLYFVAAAPDPPNASDPILAGGTGNNGIHHCRQIQSISPPANQITCATPLPSTADLAMFGCNSCGVQVVDFKGTSDLANAFAYFPNGIFTLSGTPTFQGVLWANKILSNGNVNWIVPSAGLMDVMTYMGFLPQNAISTTPNPILFDYVARATNRFRWLSN
jgi:hypothetical protein